MFKRKSISGSMVGSIKDTQECLDFCHKHNIVLAHKLITHEELPEVYKLLSEKNDSMVRYVLDIAKCNSL